MIACWACESSVPSPDAGAVYATCPACELRFASSGLAPRSRYGSAYFTEYRGGDYFATEPTRRHEARRRLDFVGPPSGEGGLLEIGCAAGFFLDEARSRGWRVTGVEPAERPAAHAREHLRLDVRVGFVEDLDFSDVMVDALCAWHTLEHIPDPCHVLRSLIGQLRPGALFAAEVPNGASVMAQRLGARWPPLEPDVHVAQWTPSAMRALLERSGLDEITITTVPFLTYVRGPVKRVNRRVLLAARQRRLMREPHPWGHELLRAVARVHRP